MFPPSGLAPISIILDPPLVRNSLLHYNIINKKVLLRERKRHTARRVVTTHSVVLSWLTPPPPPPAGPDPPLGWTEDWPPPGWTCPPPASWTWPPPRLDWGLTPPPGGQTEGQTRVKTLPSPILRMRAVMNSEWNQKSIYVALKLVFNTAVTCIWKQYTLNLLHFKHHPELYDKEENRITCCHFFLSENDHHDFGISVWEKEGRLGSILMHQLFRRMLVLNDCANILVLFVNFLQLAILTKSTCFSLGSERCETKRNKIQRGCIDLLLL